MNSLLNSILFASHFPKYSIFINKIFLQYCDTSIDFSRREHVQYFRSLTTFEELDSSQKIAYLAILLCSCFVLPKNQEMEIQPLQKTFPTCRELPFQNYTVDRKRIDAFLIQQETIFSKLLQQDRLVPEQISGEATGIKEWDALTFGDILTLTKIRKVQEEPLPKIPEKLQEKLFRDILKDKFPKTFSIVYHDPVAVPFTEFSLGTLFQLVWLVAVFQKCGVQHNSLTQSLALYHLPKVKCFRIPQSTYTFLLPSTVPIPLVTSFATLTSYKDSTDLKDICNFFRPYLKEEVERIETQTNIENILYDEIFDSFLQKQCIKSGVIAEL